MFEYNKIYIKNNYIYEVGSGQRIQSPSPTRDKHPYLVPHLTRKFPSRKGQVSVEIGLNESFCHSRPTDNPISPFNYFIIVVN